MITLLLDSTYKNLSIGLAIDNKMVDIIEYECWQAQSEYMMSELENILKRNSVDPKTVNEIVVTNGPGSYTGVRIALTIAKIYCLALNIPCYVLSSLKVLQLVDKPSICLINARSNRSYIGVYKNNEEILSDRVMKNEEVKEYIEKHMDFAICGDTDYLEIESQNKEILHNMLRLKDEKYFQKDILTLSAVYLKD